jgi:hypothetical protein
LLVGLPIAQRNKVGLQLLLLLCIKSGGPWRRHLVHGGK